MEGEQREGEWRSAEGRKGVEEKKGGREGRRGGGGGEKREVGFKIEKTEGRA